MKKRAIVKTDIAKKESIWKMKKKHLLVFRIKQYKYKNKIRDTPFERLTNLSNDEYFGCPEHSKITVSLFI